jgi:TatD DNase family protein
MFTDSHCHLSFPDFAGQIPMLLERMREAHVERAMCICTEMHEFEAVLGLAEAHENLYATVGVHPDYENSREPSVDELVQLAAHPRVLAIGETGLDYYRLNGRSVEDMHWQRERFRTHIRAGRAARKPLVVHTRSASADTIAIMQEERAVDCGAVLHCFTETQAVADAAIAAGYYISFSGIVTFKNARELQAVALSVPDDKILIETDSPYLAPVPHRGKVNEPSFVPHVAEFLAHLRGVSVEHMALITTRNFERLFLKKVHA